MANKCKIYSRASYPIVVKYDGQDTVIPPNAKGLLFSDTLKFGVLPSKIRKVDVEEGEV